MQDHRDLFAYPPWWRTETTFISCKEKRNIFTLNILHSPHILCLLMIPLGTPFRSFFCLLLLFCLQMQHRWPFKNHQTILKPWKWQVVLLHFLALKSAKTIPCEMVIHIFQSIILHTLSMLLLSLYIDFPVPHLDFLPQGKVFKSAPVATLSKKQLQEEV